MTSYWAHSDPGGLPPTAPNAIWQPLNAHLVNVGRLSEMFARLANPADVVFHRMARAAGLLHDFGKYTEEFQLMIRGASHQRAPHSAYGAAVAYLKAKAYEAAFATAGHHAGLPDAQGGQASLSVRTKELREKIDALWKIATSDCPELAECLAGEPPLLVGTSRCVDNFDVRTRMLFSCLVDADRIDTARHYRPAEANLRAAPLSAAARLQRLLGLVEEKAARVPDGAVKNARKRVLEACREAAVRSANIFSLTVPTGGAKTLASMAFALERALRFPELLRRVIVVIPFLSIIEQNAQVFIDALGEDAVLEHHSGDFERLKRKGDIFVPEESAEDEPYSNPSHRRATENWDAPVVVTTSVRFFESLFSNRPSDLRRMHNIARSVVILDEVQTLPRRLVGPILSMIRNLAEQWNTTFLFCTATQPAFEKSAAASAKDMRWAPGTVQEIMPQPVELFRQLKRVEVSWQIAGPTPWTEISGAMLTGRRALCIVNTRNQAAALYRELRRAAQSAGIDRAAILHLSTRMCAAHRLARIAEIKRALAEPSQPCLVASTQLVEAGVDLDFPTVYRAMAPFESIVQAAGRCDREGRLTATAGKPAGKVIVFETEDGKGPPDVYKEATDRTRTLAREGDLSIDEPAQIREYFERLYGEADLGKEIEDLRRAMNFREVAAAFEMIEDRTQSVFVPYDREASRWIAELKQAGHLDLRLRRLLQRYVVGLYPGELNAARQGGAIEEIRRDSDLWVCREGFYDRKLGFVAEPAHDEMVL